MLERLKNVLHEHREAIWLLFRHTALRLVHAPWAGCWTSHSGSCGENETCSITEHRPSYISLRISCICIKTRTTTLVPLSTKYQRLYHGAQLCKDVDFLRFRICYFTSLCPVKYDQVSCEKCHLDQASYLELIEGASYRTHWFTLLQGV
jgi:hypothetical protein